MRITLTITLLALLFYSFAVTSFTYAYQSSIGNNVNFELLNQTALNTTSVISKLQYALTGPGGLTNIPILDIGAIVFYTGYVWVDLLLNFAFAIPSMVTLLFNFLDFFLAIPPQFESMFKLYLFAGVTILQLIGILSYVTAIFRGGNVYLS